MNTKVIFFLLIALTFFSTVSTAKDYAKFNKDGELVRPEGFRKWVYVGTPVTPNDMNGGMAPFPEFHNVYMDPESFEIYEKTGKFRDGTVLVKELVSVGSKKAVSGNGYFMGEFVGLEATIKSKQHFPNEPGNWAYFSYGHEYPLAATAKAFPAPACNACHAASAKEDFVFTQYYPVLAAVKERSRMEVGGGSIEGMDAGVLMTAALQPTAPTGAVKSDVPTESKALFKYLMAGKYKKFSVRESSSHPSAGPHTKYGLPVRVYLDSTIARSLKNGNASHPKGSSIVKEMFDSKGKLQGWAVMVKTDDDSAGGAGWFWYEVTSTTDGSKPVAAGNGVPLCFGCHSTGKDYFLSTYPLQ